MNYSNPYLQYNEIINIVGIQNEMQYDKMKKSIEKILNDFLFENHFKIIEINKKINELQEKIDNINNKSLTEITDISHKEKQIENTNDILSSNNKSLVQQKDTYAFFSYLPSSNDDECQYPSYSDNKSLIIRDIQIQINELKNLLIPTPEITTNLMVQDIQTQINELKNLLVATKPEMAVNSTNLNSGGYDSRINDNTRINHPSSPVIHINHTMPLFFNKRRNHLFFI